MAEGDCSRGVMLRALVDGDEIRFELPGTVARDIQDHSVRMIGLERSLPLSCDVLSMNARYR